MAKLGLVTEAPSTDIPDLTLRQANVLFFSNVLERGDVVGDQMVQAGTEIAPDQFPCQSLRPQAEIALLDQDANSSGHLILLRYQPGTTVLRRHHPGYEQILVLAGDIKRQLFSPVFVLSQGSLFSRPLAKLST
ncbi:MAG: hypothetical protein ACKO5P_10890 [Nodosilinea sp.]